MYVTRFYFVTLAITFALVIICSVLSLTASACTSAKGFLFSLMSFFVIWDLLEIFSGRLYVDIDISEEKHPKCHYLSEVWKAVFPVLIIISGASAILDYLYAIPGLAVTALVGAACGLILLPVSALTAK
ncbi:MAG: hypothetical protein K1V76_01270 [Candidatus Amulumruptor sp.]